MKNIGQWLANKKTEPENLERQNPKRYWDEKSIFYAFQRVIKEEYGSQGVKNFQPDFWKNGKLFVKTESSVWASELQLKREEIRAKINQELGCHEIKEIKLK